MAGKNGTSPSPLTGLTEQSQEIVLHDAAASPFLKARAGWPQTLSSQRPQDPFSAPVLWEASLESPRLLFLDLETTGLYPKRDVIVEIALSLFVLEGNELRHLRSYVGWEDPGFPIPRRVSKIHGLERSHLAGQHIAWDLVQAFFDLADFAVGHNVFHFDARFLVQNISFDRWLDTLRYPWKKELKLPSASLPSILHALEIPSPRAHSALEDALHLALALQTVKGGVAWLESAFQRLRQGVLGKVQELQTLALATYEATGKNTCAIEVGPSAEVYRVHIEKTNETCWYSSEGNLLEEAHVGEALWRSYLQTRRTDNLYRWRDG
ncbi:MAG: 3'-5' exonuclease [Bacillota bacterium]|nr:3'-5' exonuclease [Bacillota bacterium]